MSVKYTLIFIFCCALAAPVAPGIISNILNYETDYTADETLRLIFTGVPLTFDRLLQGNDSYGPMYEEVTFWCIDRQTNQLIQTFINDTDIESKINVTRPLWTVTHGWIDNINRTWVQDMLRDIVTYYDVNACGVDWNKLANYEYSISATQHVPMVGDYLAQFIEFAVSAGVSIDNVTMIGHSLGGQISGHAGMLLGGKAGAIYGLDPAGPLFCLPFLNPINKRLDSTDAKFVQIIHTTDRMLGCHVDHGHQDFRPDGGDAPSTACIIPFASETLSPEVLSCSHSQSAQYFRFALDPSNMFTGTQCSSSTAYNMFFCKNNPTDVVGPRTQRKLGRFYLRTSFFAPFTN